MAARSRDTSGSPHDQPSSVRGTRCTRQGSLPHPTTEPTSQARDVSSSFSGLPRNRISMRPHLEPLRRHADPSGIRHHLETFHPHTFPPRAMFSRVAVHLVPLTSSQCNPSCHDGKSQQFSPHTTDHHRAPSACVNGGPVRGFGSLVVKVLVGIWSPPAMVVIDDLQRFHLCVEHVELI